MMKSYNDIKIILYSLLLLFFMNNCSEKPSPPHYTNIFDPNLGFDDNPPLLHLTFWPDSGITNETEFTFDASGSKEQEMPEATLYYRWDFNNDIVWATPWRRDSKIKHIFNKGGRDLTVKLWIMGAKNLIADTTVNIFVNTRPNILFRWQTDLDNENMVYFDAAYSRDFEDGINLEYRWDFNNDGDWDIAWNTNPLAEYLFNVDDWSVKLEVRDTDHLSATKIISKNGMDF